MAVPIKNLFEKEDNSIFYPKTSIDAVVLSDGTQTLGNYLATLKEKLDSFEDSEDTPSVRGLEYIKSQYRGFERTASLAQVQSASNWSDTPIVEIDPKYPIIWKRTQIKYTNKKDPEQWQYEVCSSLGQDGKSSGTEFIYYLKKSSENSVSIPESVQQDQHIPSGWYRNPPTIEESTQNASIYMSSRTKTDGTWSEWSAPSLWGIDFESLKTDLNTALVKAIEETDKTRAAAQDALDQFSRDSQTALNDLEGWKNEINSEISKTNVISQNFQEFLINADAKVGEVIRQQFATPAGYAALVGKTTDDTGSKTFSEVIQNYDQVLQFVGEIATNEDGKFSEYLNTQLDQKSDEIKMNAARNIYQSYNGDGKDPSVLELGNKTIELDVKNSYYCVYRPSKVAVTFTTDGDITETCTSGEYSVPMTNSLKISWEEGEIEEIDLYKTLNSSYSSFSVTPEKIKAVVKGQSDDPEKYGSLLAQLVLEDDQIKQSVIFDDENSNYVKKSDLVTTADKILAQVGKSNYKELASIELTGDNTGLYCNYTDATVTCSLLGGVNTVKYVIQDDSITTQETVFILYEGGSIEIPSGKYIILLKDTEEERITVRIVTNPLAERLASLEIQDDQITAAVNEYFEKEGLQGSALEMTSNAIKTAVFNDESFTSVIQSLDEVSTIVNGEDGNSGLVQKVDSMALQVQSGAIGNLLPGLLDLDGWEIGEASQERTTRAVNQFPSGGMVDTNPSNLPSNNLVQTQAGTTTGNSTLIGTESIPQPNKQGLLSSESLGLLQEGGLYLRIPGNQAGYTKALISPEFNITTQRYNGNNQSEDQFYVLSWQGANHKCLSSVELIQGSTSIFKVPITNLDTKDDGEPPADYKFMWLGKGGFNLAFKSPGNATVKLKFNILIDAEYKEGGSIYEYVNFGKLKLEEGYYGLDSIFTAWTPNNTDTLKSSRLALTTNGMISRFENRAADIENTIKQEQDKTSLLVRKGENIGGLVISSEGSSFTGPVNATTFKVTDASGSTLSMGIWGDELKTTYNINTSQEKFAEFRNIPNGTPVLLATTSEGVFLLNMTQIPDYTPKNPNSITFIPYLQKPKATTVTFYKITGTTVNDDVTTYTYISPLQVIYKNESIIDHGKTKFFNIGSKKYYSDDESFIITIANNRSQITNSSFGDKLEFPITLGDGESISLIGGNTYNSDGFVYILETHQPEVYVNTTQDSGNYQTRVYNQFIITQGDCRSTGKVVLQAVDGQKKCLTFNEKIFLYLQSLYMSGVIEGPNKDTFKNNFKSIFTLDTGTELCEIPETYWNQYQSLVSLYKSLI